MASANVNSLHRRFLLSILVFCAPILLLVSFEELVFYRGGETWTIEQVSRDQRSRADSLFLRRLFDQQFYLYKFNEVRRREPEVLALGSSRVMQFRAAMFGADGQSFYNAGGMIQCVGDLTLVLKQMPDLRPRVVILGVDIWWLNNDWDKANLDNSDRGSAHPTDAAISWEAHLLALRRIWLNEGDVFKSWKRYLEVLLSPRENRVGLAAQLDNCGFRATDGSYAFPPNESPSPESLERLSAIHLRRIAEEDMQFLPSPGLSPRLLNELRGDLLELNRRGVLVIGFLPPFSSPVVRALEGSKHQKDLWHQYAREIPALFAELNLPCIDASTSTNLGLDDRYMRDGVHAMETFHLYLLRAMLDDPRVERALPTARGSVTNALASHLTDAWHPDLSLSAGTFERKGSVPGNVNF